MKRIDWFEDEEGNLTKFLISDERFETMHMTTEKEGEPNIFALKLTEEIEDAITQGWES